MDRKGRQEEATALVAELTRDARKIAGARPGPDDPLEAQAAFAFVLERVDARHALSLWERYLEAVGERAPWAAHARARIDHLQRSGGRR
jgi:hypothetical protein